MPKLDECSRQLLLLERELEAEYVKQERRLSALYGEGGYGGIEGGRYVDAAIVAFRESNAAWRSFRDKDCWYEALRDGMSISYAGAIAESCKVERTSVRLRHFLDVSRST